jgi:hypothetical protein
MPTDVGNEKKPLILFGFQKNLSKAKRLHSSFTETIEIILQLPMRAREISLGHVRRKTVSDLSR